jgi:hypothetical protein
MLNLFKNKKTKNENIKPKLSIAKQINNLSSFENINTTVKTCLDNRKNTYKSFIENLPYEIALGQYLIQLDIEASKQKNRNKWKHNQLAKSGFGKHTTNDKNQSTFEYIGFTRQELNIRKQIAKEYSLKFVNFCNENTFTSTVYAWQQFKIANKELFATSDKSKSASHNRKTTKQSKTNKKEASKNTVSFDSQKMLDKIVNNKAYKDLSHEELSKQCLVLLEVMFAENGMEFNKLITNDKTKGTILKALKIA